jgi:hypothetical protein
MAFPVVAVVSSGGFIDLDFTIAVDGCQRYAQANKQR